MKYKIAFIITMMAGIVSAQVSDTLTLQACYDSLYRNFPTARQTDIYKKMIELKIKNINSDYLPTLNLGGQASVQSDVTHLQLQMDPAGYQAIAKYNVKMPVPPLDQYKAYLEIGQVIYDGGIIRSRKDLEILSNQSQQKAVEIELYAIRERINSLYFGLMLVRENKVILQNLRTDLGNRIKTVTAGVAAGAVLESNLNILKAEALKLEQKITEAETMQSNMENSIQEIIHRPVNSTTLLSQPDLDAKFKDATVRPENELFEIQLLGVDKTINLLKATRRPKMFAFAQAGYGRPGLNMLSTTFDPYAIVGAKISWTLYDWGKTQRDIKFTEYQKDLIATRSEAFSMNQRIFMNTEMSNIHKYESIISKDISIIDLRESISKTAASRFDNGSINATDYLIEKTAETQARLEQKTHEIQMLQAKVNYLTISGQIK